jgi:hypothetical protein
VSAYDVAAAFERKLATLRARVEAEVERLRHEAQRHEEWVPDVIDIDPLLAAIAAIFEGVDPTAQVDRKTARDPWPLSDVLRRLCDAADHLLGDHNCDHHGYEEIGAARKAGRVILEALLESALANGARQQDTNLRGLLERCLSALRYIAERQALPKEQRVLLADLREALGQMKG